MANKRHGRIGDPPIVGAGAGACADDRCAVSGTGWGEFSIRVSAAHEICARIACPEETPVQAGEAVINREIPALGGDGGAIVLSADGRVAMPFNTGGMGRGWIGSDGVSHVALYSDEALALPDGGATERWAALGRSVPGLAMPAVAPAARMASPMKKSCRHR